MGALKAAGLIQPNLWQINSCLLTNPAILKLLNCLIPDYPGKRHFGFEEKVLLDEFVGFG